MTPEEVQKRFVEEINLRAYDDQFIDKNEEREILQIAIHHGMSVEEARLSLQQVCTRQGYALESSLMDEVKTRLQQLHHNSGKVEQAAFADLVELVRRQAGPKRNDRDAKRLVVIVMEDHALNHVKLRWPLNWYRRVKKEVGIR